MLIRQAYSLRGSLRGFGVGALAALWFWPVGVKVNKIVKLSPWDGWTKSKIAENAQMHQTLHYMCLNQICLCGEQLDRRVQKWNMQLLYFVYRSRQKTPSRHQTPRAKFAIKPSPSMWRDICLCKAQRLFWHCLMFVFSTVSDCSDTKLRQILWYRDSSAAFDPPRHLIFSFFLRTPLLSLHFLHSPSVRLAPLLHAGQGT